MRYSTVHGAQITGRDLSVCQRRIICRMRDGNKMYTSAARIWLDCTWEAGVMYRTWTALRMKGLIRIDQRCLAAKNLKQILWKLTRKGRVWARLTWRP